MEDSGAFSVHWSGSKLVDHEYHITRLVEQMSYTAAMCAEMRSDIRMLLDHASRQKERDNVHDRMIKIIPVAITLISCIYYIVKHMHTG